ncbi:MAG: hypothetical protein HY782_09910 [Chloroflexi bacterium]|nr:hypothetical protein [Chloroflexota bacterium]
MAADFPRVESFVLRFVQDLPRDEQSDRARGWHGAIVHVQTNEEKSFARFADVIAFIARYVHIGDFVLKDEGVVE